MKNQKPLFMVALNSGFAIRNWILSGIIEELKKDFDVNLLIPSLYRDHLQSNILEKENIVLYKGINFPRFYKFLRGINIKIENRKLGNYDPYFEKWHIKINKGKEKIILIIQYGLSKILAKSKLYYKLKKLEEDILKKSIKKIEINPNIDLLISTNPFSILEYPLISKAKSLNIPCLGSILSWDNLLWMGRVPEEADYFFVWGPQMREDLKRHLPHISDERIFEVGSPQFDFHLDPQCFWDKEKFFNYLNLKEERKIICYGANTKEHFFNEPLIVENIMISIKENKIKNNPLLILRIHPHDNTGRFDYLKEKFPEIVFSKLNGENNLIKTWFIPKEESLAVFSNTIRYSSLNINLASSLTLDFAFLDKPTINIAFSPIEGDPFSLRIPMYYSSPHYKKVIEMKAVKVAYNMQELVDSINEMIEDPGKLSKERKELVERICGGNKVTSKSRIIQAIKTLFEK